MPANQSIGGEKPAVKSTASNPVTKWFTDRLLLLAVTIFLLVLLFVIGFSGQGKSALRGVLDGGKQSLDLGDTSDLFQSQLDSEKFDNFLASRELGKAFVYLSDEYNRSPSDDKRKALIKLADSIKRGFPDQKEGLDLSIPCREESCGVVINYTTDISSLKEDISKASVLTDQQKKSVLFSLGNAALAKGNEDEKAEFNDLFSAFQQIRYFWQLNKNESIRNLALDTLNVMEKVTPDYYRAALNQGLLSLK